MSEKKYLNPAEWDTPISNSNFWIWRNYLKGALIYKRHYKSDLSGLPLNLTTGCELHEGIITRAVVPLSVKWHFMIYHEFNSFLLLPHEHRPQPPSRKWCVERAYELYSRDEVRNWYYGYLPWKSKPPFQLP